MASTGCGDLLDGLDADEQAVVSEVLQRDGVDGAQVVERLDPSAKRALARFVADGDVRDGVVDRRAVDLLAQMDDDAATAMFKVDGRITNFHRWDEWRAALVAAGNDYDTPLVVINKYVESIDTVSQRDNVENVAGLIDEVADNPHQLPDIAWEAEIAEKYSQDGVRAVVEPIKPIDLAVKQSDGGTTYIEVKNARTPLKKGRIRRGLSDGAESFTSRAERNDLDITNDDERVVTFGVKRHGISDEVGQNREEIRQTLENTMKESYPKNSNRPDGLEVDTIRIITDDRTYEFKAENLYE